MNKIDDKNIGNTNALPENTSLSKEFLLLAELSKDVVFMLNGEGFFTFFNENGARQLDYFSDELIGKHFFDLISEKDKLTVSEAFNKILTEKTESDFQTEVISKFGNNLIFNIRTLPVENDGRVEGLIAIAYDVTNLGKEERKLKELNAKLIEANRIISIERDRAKQKISVLEELNSLKSDFISNMSHELRTPLASIVGFSETIDTDTELTADKIKEFNKIILDESKRLAKLIDDILDFSKLEREKEPLNKAEFDLILLLKTISKEFRDAAASKNISFSLEIPEAEIKIFADKERITKVVKNLLSNAVKFTESGGRVTLIVQDFLKETEIIISDTGIGIPQEEIPFIFEKFRKLETRGKSTKSTGLGLVTVKKIIDLHKGLIRVKSEVNKGTTFIIRLPKN